MKIVALIARILIGLLFLVFGLNGFLQFIPMKTLPPGLAGQFATVLMQSHYVLFVSALQIAGGALLLVNRYVPLGLTILGPVIVNIILYHALMDLAGLPLAIVVAIFGPIAASRQRKYSASLFVQKTS